MAVSTRATEDVPAAGAAAAAGNLLGDVGSQARPGLLNQTQGGAQPFGFPQALQDSPIT